MPILLARVAAVFSCLMMVACSNPEPEPERDPVPVVAQPIRMLPETLEIEAIGSARASTSAEIFPETAGRVTAVLFAAGDFVREGAPLLRLDARQEQLAVDAARVQVREADQLLGRYRRIEDTGAISESQIEAGETALASARVALQQAETALADRVVRAPFSGHVGLTDIDRGDRVNDSTPITQIDQRGTLYVDFPAPESVFNALRPGQVVQVTPFSDPARTIDARVVTTDSRVSQDSRDFIVRTAIPNPDDQLRPGMSFRVVFSRNGETRAAVPEQAIVWGGEGSHLFVVRDGKASRVPVTITARREGLVFVDGRVNASDRVIVEGVQKVREGQEIRLVQPRGAPAQDVRIAPSQAAADGE
ncbi:efflux RND transporter periplasmic adaptor subunit [Qipengyuania sp. DY56-A-20]|jgi:RND family efflux transporter MFP subunit|uniref:Efflux RND transporter periplasmic adaptor subunit n=1 Tax=Qipengyuania benthica TaxID=3067651 RepID=A0ABT9H648_9SPHN|nr:efflux RND transporter periplasmic adaptor subunit [Qipengyuania sp. DY56-A-20]MDP4538786.1 efflux RND transporter periplasmic adaptor subunit [Qipengyuania sp. DY56-A-20]